LNCFESVDHTRIDIRELNELISSAKAYRQNIDEVKATVSRAYEEIRRTFEKKLGEDQHVFQEWINQFYFPHLAGKTNMPLLTQLA
jgi:endonuclease III-like uncharacterized protein